MYDEDSAKLLLKLQMFIGELGLTQHDLVCNADHRVPIGKPGSGCSCLGRLKRDIRTALVLYRVPDDKLVAKTVEYALQEVERDLDWMDTLTTEDEQLKLGRHMGRAIIKHVRNALAPPGETCAGNRNCKPSVWLDAAEDDKHVWEG
jgi:hypothetical protein